MVHDYDQERRYSIYPENRLIPVCGFEGFGPWLCGLAAFELGEAVCYGGGTRQKQSCSLHERPEAERKRKGQALLTLREHAPDNQNQALADALTPNIPQDWD